MFNKNINNNQKKSCLQKLFALLFLLLLVSCEDYGCYDADDFGEYESYTFKVESSRLGEFCTYKNGSNEADQPIGIRECMSDNNCYTSSSKKSCAQACEDNCRADATKTLNEVLQPGGTETPQTAEPLWTSVGGGAENNLTIEHNSQILITAQGTLDLGSEVQKSTVIINQAYTGKEDLNQLQTAGNSSFATFSGKENVNITIDGKFTDNAYTYFDTRVNPVNSDVKIDYNLINYYEQSIANGARRIFAYFIPSASHPEKYEKFPLAPDPSKWQCSIEEEYLNCSKNTDCSEENQSNCDSYIEIDPLTPLEQQYNAHFSTPYNAAKANEDISKYNLYFSNFFNVDNLSKETSRYNNGTGFIRYKGDNLNGTDNNLLSITKLEVSSSGRKTELTSFPNYQTDYAIKFKNFDNVADGIPCANFTYTIKDPDIVGDGVEYPVTLGETTYVINKKDLKNVWYSGSSTTNSACSVKVFFYPFHEIEFSESGYIEFGIPDKVLPVSTNSDSECKLKFKIFNKGATKDEFKNFLYPPSYRDAVQNESVPHVIVEALLQTPFIRNNPKKYFIRKGQILSFHPDSWNGTWTPREVASVNSPKCGIGFYVKLTPRPAVFCSDKVVKEFMDINQDNSLTNDCNNLYYDESVKKHTGCLEDRALCNTTTNLCPSECIPREFKTCRPSTTTLSDDKLFEPASSLCNPSNPEKLCYDDRGATVDPICGGATATIPANCHKYSLFLTIDAYRSLQTSEIKASCERCKVALMDVAKTQFFNKTNIELQQCYDLENYTGTMEELKTKLNALTSETSLRAYKIFEDLKAKGLKKLETFNGNYGNFYPLAYTGKQNTNNPALPIYKIKNLISIGRPGYLKFIILDDIPIAADANPDYFETSLTSTARNSISINPPLRINIKSSNELSNGEGLTIALCKESSANSYDCSRDKTLILQKGTFGGGANAVLPIIENTDSGLSEISNYKFNPFGQLIRITSLDSSQVSDPRYLRECTSKDNIIPYINSNFLCFRDYNNSLVDNPSLDKKYRLTFKIFDKETANCKDKNSTYEDCTPASPPSFPESCNKFKIYNQNWDGKTPENSYCNQSNDNECINKYRCNSDKYANNEGHYDVAVKIRRDSKVKVSNFIDSIISPILGQVDGFYQTNKIAYNQIPYVSSYISQNTTTNDSPTSIPLEIRNRDQKILNQAPPIGVSLTSSEKVIELKPECDNCFISYVIKSALIYEGCSTPPFSIDLNVKDSCEGFAKCSFLASNTSIKYSNGRQFHPSSSNSLPSNCTIKKVYIEYLYSKSDKPLFKENQVRRIYKSILVNPVYKSFLTLSIVLMLSFYGMGFLMGVSELKQSEIVDRLIKIAIIYLFTNPEFGWVWFEKFFVTFFKNGTDFLTFTMAGLFDETNEIESALRTGNFSNKSLIFGGVDRVVQLFLINDVIHKKIGALMFYKFFGILYVMIIYYSAIAYVYAVSNAVLIYLTSQFFTSVLFIVGPLFFVFILFKQTKGFFDNWLNALIGFGLQQIFLVFTLSLFNAMLYMVIKLTLGFRVCWDSVWQIHLPGGINISLLSFWTPQDFPPYLGEATNPTAEGSSGSIPTIPRLLSLWTICVIMKSFITQITNLAANLSGGISATELGSSVAGGMNNMINQTQKTMGDIYKKSGARIIDRVDQRLFNSGDLAKKARAKEKNKNSHDNKVKERMKKDGDKAVSNYKTENSQEYAGMSEAQKRGKLNEVKKEAMKDSAKSMGKTEKEAEALMNDKSGSKYQGDNVFGAMMSIGKDRFKSRSFGIKSLNEKASEFDTGMSEKEMKKTIKGMEDADPSDPLDKLDKSEKREKFINDIKNGNIQGEVSKKDISLNYEERKTAINQLQKSGDIATPIFDQLGLAKRSESEEKKILDRIEKNRNEQSIDGGREVDPKKINRLEAFANYLEAKEGKNNKKDQLEAKTELHNAEYKPDKDNIEKIGNESSIAVEEKLNKQKSNNDIEKAKAEAKVSSSKETLSDIQASIAGNGSHARMDELFKKIDKKDSSSSDVKEFNTLKEQDQKQPNQENTFAEKNKQRSLTIKQLANDKAELNNYEIKERGINTALEKLPSKNKPVDNVGGQDQQGNDPSAP